MLALGVSQALEGSATSASVVTCTVSGLLMNNANPPVATGYQVLDQQYLLSSVTSIYNPGASATALISNIQLMNTVASVNTVNLYLTGTGAVNQIATLQIPANGWATYDDGAGWSLFTAAGVQITTTTTLANTQFRSATATLNPNEYTIFNGSTAAQTLTLPAAPPDATLVDIANYATVSVTLAPGAGATLNVIGTTGSSVVLVEQMIHLVYSASQLTWYSTITNVGNQDVGPGAVNAGVATTTQTVNSTTLTNITGLSVPLLGSSQYRFEAEIFATNSATASTGISVGVTVPSGATLVYDVFGNQVSSSTRVANFVTTNTATGSFITTSGFTGFIKISGAVLMSTATGSVTIQISSQTGSTTAAGTATVNTGSNMVVIQL